jgi:hypothetical protein
MSTLTLPVYLAGALVMFWRIWRFLEGIAERDCPCQRSRMTMFATMAAANPGGYLLALGVFSLCWPVLAVATPIKRFRRRNAPRCPRCGMRSTTTEEAR